MQAYEAGNPAYFSTPPVNLIYALHAALTAITKNEPSLPERLKLHKQASQRVRKECENLGLKQVKIVDMPANA
jgi:alanine-glyoxylate transaminase/serine-glyoxylate transaminase/serine-pyruvate transaminase